MSASVKNISSHFQEDFQTIAVYSNCFLHPK